MGFSRKSDTMRYTRRGYSSFFAFKHKQSLFLENPKAINLGFGQSPMSRRLLIYFSEIPLRFRMESLQSITIV